MRSVGTHGKAVLAIARGYDTAYVLTNVLRGPLSRDGVLQGSGSLKRGRSPASPDLDLGEALVAGRRKRASLPSTASLAADEEPTGNRDPAGDPADQRPGVFAGLRFVFWVDRFSSKLRAG